MRTSSKIVFSLFALTFSFSSVSTSFAAPTWGEVYSHLVSLGIPVASSTAEHLRSECIAKDLILGTPAKIQSIHLTAEERLGISTSQALSAPAGSVNGMNVSLTCQMAYFVSAGKVVRVFPVSTGRPGLATPKGTFKISWQVNAWYDSLAFPGTMLYRPKFFYKGDAIHGLVSDSSVLPYPDSHGCVRTKKKDVDWLWKTWKSTDRIHLY